MLGQGGGDSLTQSVLGWEATWEHWVLYAFVCFSATPSRCTQHPHTPSSPPTALLPFPRVPTFPDYFPAPRTCCTYWPIHHQRRLSGLWFFLRAPRLGLAARGGRGVLSNAAIPVTPLIPMHLPLRDITHSLFECLLFFGKLFDTRVGHCFGGFRPRRAGEARTSEGTREISRNQSHKGMWQGKQGGALRGDFVGEVGLPPERHV